MTLFTDPLLRSMASSLQAELQACAVTPVAAGHTTGWRTLPGIATALIDYQAFIRFEGHPPIPVGPHETLCIPPGVFHCLDVPATSGTSRWSHTAFRVLGGLDICIFLVLPPVITGEASRRIGAINAALATTGAQTLAGIARQQALLFELLECLAGAAVEKADAPELTASVRRLAPALDFIAGHLDRMFRVEVLADLCGLSRSRFDALFRRVMGVAPGRYALRLRLQRAQRLLMTTETPVEEVAASAGFAGPFHFSRIFKKHCGATPAAYRGRTRKAGM